MTEERNRTRGIRAEMLVGVSVVVIGVCALGVSLYETSPQAFRAKTGAMHDRLAVESHHR